MKPDGRERYFLPTVREYIYFTMRGQHEDAAKWHGFMRHITKHYNVLPRTDYPGKPENKEGQSHGE